MSGLMTDAMTYFYAEILRDNDCYSKDNPAYDSHNTNSPEEQQPQLQVENELEWNGKVTSASVPVKANSCYHSTIPAASGDSDPLYSTIGEDTGSGQECACEYELMKNQAYIKSTSIPAVDGSLKNPEQFGEMEDKTLQTPRVLSDYDYVVTI